MATCRSCFKSGLFFRVNEKGYCSRCAETYKENLINHISSYQKKISERKNLFCIQLDGVKQNNPKTGVSRQKLIKRSRVGEKLMIMIDEEKHEGSEKIKASGYDGRQLGFLKAGNDTEIIKNHMKNKLFIDASISSISCKKGNCDISVNLTAYS